MEEVGLKDIKNLKWRKREEGTVRPKGREFPLQLTSDTYTHKGEECQTGHFSFILAVEVKSGGT